jgi:hypothetical protein
MRFVPVRKDYASACLRSSQDCPPVRDGPVAQCPGTVSPSIETVMKAGYFWQPFLGSRCARRKATLIGLWRGGDIGRQAGRVRV